MYFLHMEAGQGYYNLWRGVGALTGELVTPLVVAGALLGISSVRI